LKVLPSDTVRSRSLPATTGSEEQAGVRERRPSRARYTRLIGFADDSISPPGGE
jgi:hypothetical protein